MTSLGCIGAEFPSVVFDGMLSDFHSGGGVDVCRDVPPPHCGGAC